MSSDAAQQDQAARFEDLIQIQKEVQAKWAQTKPYQVNAPSNAEERAKRNKFLVTFPYPYMNGALHLGHAFTVVKAEFAVRYQRLLGKKALFPFGFHCTGMPILACAKRLQEELAKFGPQGPPSEKEQAAADADAAVVEDEQDPETVDEQVVTEQPDATATAVAAPVEKKRKKKGKLAAKSSKMTYQWNIMRSMGVAEEEIHEFADTKKWLDYWPPIAQKDLTDLGMAIDWRRTFITTDVNPYYDAFIRWQFNHLKAKEKVGFGKLMCIYSTSNDSVCADHDRKEGEGVTPQEYTLIKLKLQQPYPQALIDLFTSFNTQRQTQGLSIINFTEGMNVILPAATLRPETMYGQTNAFLKPDGSYGVYVINDNEVYVCGEHSINNIAYQDIFGTLGEHSWSTPSIDLPLRTVGSILGKHFFGHAVQAPLSKYEHVYLFPLTTILMDKGTGIVTSVPSDAPTDYAMFNEVKTVKRDYYRDTYGITDEMVTPYDVIEIIHIEDEQSNTNTNCIARDLCLKAKITTHKDDKLPALKDEAYRLGFDRGVMIMGTYTGKLAKDCRELCKNDLIASNDAVAYSEPESTVISRLGDICVCAKVDQWFLKYGEKEWCDQIYNYANDDSKFNTYNNQIKHKLLATIRWLQRWGCSRAFGLGTKLPFDDKYLVESLSDSTIYMAYYTIVHILQGGHLDGRVPTPEEQNVQHIAAPQVAVEHLTDALFDYIFLDKPYDATTITVSREICDKMRQEFEFWYPHDLRVSGKDLLQNHLVMSLYNHAAIWDGREDRMPGGYYTNGLLMINGNKMSKSTGNFMTLAEAIVAFGSDALRFGLASSGDSLEDANFSTKVASGAIIKLAHLKELITLHYIPHIINQQYRQGEFQFWDIVALQRLTVATQAMQTSYESMQMLDVIRHFHIILAIRDEYRIAITPPGAVVTRADYVDSNFHQAVIAAFIHVIVIGLSPIVPHWAQSMHQHIIDANLYTLTGIEGTIIPACPVNGRPELVIDERWPVITPPNTDDVNILSKAQYILSQSEGTRVQYNNFLQLTEKKAKKQGVDLANVPSINHVTIRVAIGYPEWQKNVILTAQQAYKQHGETAFTTHANTLKGDVSKLFPTDKKLKTNAMKFLVQLIQDFTQAEGSIEERYNNAFSLDMPFDEIGLWKEFTSFFLRAMEPISSANPETFAIVPYDPLNPVDEEGNIIQFAPRPGKPVFTFAHRD